MPKTRNVRLRTPDAELEFAIQANTTGKLLFEQVSKTVGLREIWYFGIAFTDTKGDKEWIKLGKKVIGGHDLRKEDPIELELKIKFYPESAEEDLIQEVTKRYFFIELKQSILNDEIYCSAPTCALLASYACQVKYGDYNESIQFQNDKLLPTRVIDQHSMSKEEWAEKIVGFWAQYRDMIKEDAMLEYIKIVQDLEMYGVSYFDIKNKKGTDLLLGVDALGLNIYEKENKLTPRIGFPWSEIRNISFNDKKFIIKPIDKKAPDFIFLTTRLRTNKRILSLCMGNHELYMRRRKGDTIEIQQMKAQVKEERDEKLAEKERQKSLRQEREAMEEENKKLRQEMEEIRLREHEMAENLRRKEQEKEETERKAYELEAANQRREEEMRQLEERRAYVEQELEKQKVESAIRSAEENERINEQLNKLQIEKEELEKQYNLAEKEKTRQQEAFELREREHELQLRHAGLVHQQSIDEDIRSASVDMSHSANIINDKSEESRQTYHGQQSMKQQLLVLGQELEKDKNKSALTQNDIIHQENVEQKRDKFKTLKQVRAGNTKQRVDQFENLT